MIGFSSRFGSFLGQFFGRAWKIFARFLAMAEHFVVPSPRFLAGLPPSLNANFEAGPGSVPRLVRDPHVRAL